MDKRIEATRKIIESRYREALTLKEIGRSVDLSRSHLEFLFKRETGLTLKACLREARLQHAAQVLGKEHVSIKEAAFTAGYLYNSSFDRDFRRRFGKTPSEYRRVSADYADSTD